MPPVHTSRRQSDEPSPKIDIAAEPSQPTIASLAARGFTPDTEAPGLDPWPGMDPLLRMGMLVSLALTTVFLGAKYFFDRQVAQDSSTDSEVNVAVAGVSMACVCGVGCALSMCCAKPTPRQVCARAVQRTPSARSNAAHV